MVFCLRLWGVIRSVLFPQRLSWLDPPICFLSIFDLTLIYICYCRHNIKDEKQSSYLWFPLFLLLVQVKSTVQIPLPGRSQNVSIKGKCYWNILGFGDFVNLSLKTVFFVKTKSPKILKCQKNPKFVGDLSSLNQNLKTCLSSPFLTQELFHLITICTTAVLSLLCLATDTEEIQKRWKELSIKRQSHGWSHLFV